MLTKQQIAPPPPMPSITIPIYRPAFWGNEKRYVNDCLDTMWISSRGSYVEKFESQFADYTGNSHAIAACNGTVVLHLAMVALGIGPGDEVIVPSLTYVATTNAVRYVGATPIFVDSRRSDWQIDPDAVRAAITARTKAIIVVHLYGHPCPMEEIMAIAAEHKLKVVEDAAEAFGSFYKDKHVGNFGDLATYSFFGNKTITTGEGGMITCSDPVLHKTIRQLRNQGNSETQEYWHDIIGYNYRMTNVCAAIGLAQLEKADEILGHKRQIAAWYRQRLKGLPLQFHDAVGNVNHSHWMCSIALHDPALRDPLRVALREQGIETRPVFHPNHTLPMYATANDLPNASYLAAAGMNLPSYPTLTEQSVESVCSAIHSFLCEQ